MLCLGHEPFDELFLVLPCAGGGRVLPIPLKAGMKGDSAQARDTIRGRGLSSPRSTLSSILGVT